MLEIYEEIRKDKSGDLVAKGARSRIFLLKIENYTGRIKEIPLSELTELKIEIDKEISSFISREDDVISKKCNWEVQKSAEMISELKLKENS